MLRVFIADDSAVMRSRLREAFEELGFVEVVGESGNAEQAITGIRQLDPQVVIIDVRMPGGGGLPILKDLKARTPGRIAIVLTSFPFPQHRQAYLGAGADYFFDKGCDIGQLLDLLEGISQRTGNAGFEVEQ